MKIFDPQLQPTEVQETLNNLQQSNIQFIVTQEEFTVQDFLDAVKKLRPRRYPIILNTYFREAPHRQRLASIEQAINSNIPLPVLFLNFCSYGLIIDGCHRALVCQKLFGADFKVPVLCVRLRNDTKNNE